MSAALTPAFIADIKQIIDAGVKTAYMAANSANILTYWHIGKRIVEEEQGGNARAEYGAQLISHLAKELTATYGRNYSKRNLEFYRQFYLNFNDLEIVNTCVHNLTWSHFRRLLAVPNPEARQWYATHAAQEMWSTRTLDRQIATQFCERRLAAHKELPKSDAVVATDATAANPEEYLRNPVIAEFMGFRKDTKFDESELEKALIANLQQFIMELGRGFAFVERQQHIVTETDDFYIDLVFYNFKMKRFVIFELKTHKLTHQDVGQLDMYVRMYDDLVKGADDLPTIGVLLCTDTDRTIARYSVLHGSEQLFAAKYMAYMPTEDELRREIESQKQFFLEQSSKGNNEKGGEQ